ncbi:tyrosine-type recombinase/integrase [Amphibacillus sp. Q70]|uniref:tyrosine-type recombinase/integrase n=1 Tax=Amphibacillus sp. Q70 TaxID=3453416 RepID=UPI003F83EF92
MASYEELAPLKDGTPRIKITVEQGYSEITGKRKRHTKTVRMKSMSDRAVKKAMTDFEIEVAKKEDESNIENITFRKFVERWMNIYIKIDLSVNSRDAYAVALKGGILDKFENMQIKKIKTFHIAEFFAEQKKDNKKNLPNKYITLRSIFNKAVQWDVIKDNPMLAVEKPLKNKREYDRDFYDEAQLKELFKVLNNVYPKYKIQIKLAAMTGLRLAEICGIRKENINYNNNTILVDKQLKYDSESKKLFLDDTKTKKERTVNVPSELMKELKTYDTNHSKFKMSRIEWNPLLDEEGKEINLLFTNDDGYPTFPSSTSRAFKEIINKHNLPTMPFHGLRHTCASYMVSKGINFKIIQEQLGHSDIKMTLDRYSHLTKKDKREAINVFNAIL